MVEPAGTDAAIVEQHHLGPIVGFPRARRDAFPMWNFARRLEVIPQERVRAKDVGGLSRRVPGPIAAHHKLSSHRRLRALPYFRPRLSRASQTRIDEVSTVGPLPTDVSVLSRKKAPTVPFDETGSRYNHYPRSKGP